MFADLGTNLVRIRLWIDPSWWQSPLQQPAGVKPLYYDIEDVRETIQRSKDAGMKVMLDMHFSDFWADPGRQLVPCRWIGVATNNDLLHDSIYNYTKLVFIYLSSKGLMPDIVKVGNETNGGILRYIPQDNNSFEIESTINAAGHVYSEQPFKTNIYFPVTHKVNSEKPTCEPYIQMEFATAINVASHE